MPETPQTPAPRIEELPVGSLLSTVGGPSTAADTDADAPADEHLRLLAARMAGTAQMAGTLAENACKAGEYGDANARAPAAGATAPSPDPMATASTVSELAGSPKVGDTPPADGADPLTGPLDRVRVNSGGQALTTNQGVPIADNQNSLKAGLRGPTLLEDFILREKITHFDHERIPERVVHARGSAAHGFFEAYEDLSDITMAAPFAHAGKRTPVFVRFSTVVGERGSTDLARDVRGFAVKFYTDEGNWDLVGNNMPVFFIQDPMKFPDLVHAVKAEPHHAMPQAASAHDTFWDFAGLMPEITHMLMWVMSDRAIPRSYRTMQGFGVHTFRMVDAEGRSTFVKFHWLPLAGTHSLVWDEAVKVSGADPDFHRRDLWESIEAGNHPEYELGLQLFSEDDAERFSFDVLDPTKIIPEELVPLRIVGRMTLNRNPDNFFAETEQVAFCTQHVVRGIDFSNDPLLQGRNFSYLDTQISRLGGPNFHEIPINAPVAAVHNNQRDGMHRQAIPRGRVSYEPNSLGGGCPFQAGMARGFVSFPAVHVPPDKLRGKPEKFADHFTQARLFYRSQTTAEQNHIVAAFRFELSKCQVHAVRQRIVAMLRNVDETLAQRIADGLGMPLPPAQTPVLPDPAAPEVEVSPALSLRARRGDGTIKGRRIALMIGPGFEAASIRAVCQALIDAGAVPRYISLRLGMVTAADGEGLEIEVTLENSPSVLWDALVIADGMESQAHLAGAGQALEFIKDQYRHCKPILALGWGESLLEAAGLPATLPDGSPDTAVIRGAGSIDEAEPTDDLQRPLDELVTAFSAAVAAHRNFDREQDPPVI